MDNMLNGYAYHEVVWDDKGEPVDYIFLEVNEAFEIMTALHEENIIGEKVTDILPEVKGDPADWIHIYGDVAKTGKSRVFEQYSKSLDKWFKVSAFSPEKGYFATVLEDITDTKTARKLWSFAQLGRIANEMAHDVNNPIQVISGRAHILLMDAKGNKELERNLNIIREQCSKANGVIEEMLKIFEGKAE